MKNSLLSGLRALDLTDEKGFMCGKILGTMGVDVIKIEKPGGDESRNIPPFIDNIPDPAKSLYWLAFNTDKRGITLNLETDKGKSLFIKLVGGADFVLESFTPGYMNNLGLGYESLSRMNPGIIMTSITPFGQKGPYSGYKGSELIASAMSGIMNGTGDPDRAPVREGPDSIYMRSGAAAILGTVMAYYHRQRTGEGQQVDVSLQEVAVSRTSSDLVVWEFDKRQNKRSSDIRRVGARATRWIWKCKDGYLFWPYMGGPVGAPANRAISKWLDDDGLDNPLRHIENWDEFDMATIPVEELNIQQEAIVRLFENHTKEEIAEEGLRRGIRASVIKNPADVLEDRQLEDRNFWVGLDYPETDVRLNYPGHFFLSNETENYVRFRAPFVGEHNNEIFIEELGLSEKELIELKNSGVI